MNWQPTASLDHLRQRAALMAAIRDFFVQRGYLEVETPVMASHGVTDVYLHNIKAQFRGQPYALQTSPEYHMKRLLAAGSGPIFQLARVFRDDELGAWHNPEFTLLEWYQLDVDHHGLMQEVEALLGLVLGSQPLHKMTYQQAFQAACDLDPFDLDQGRLAAVLADYDLDKVLPADEEDRDQYLFLLMSFVVEPYLATLDCPVAVYDFPPSQASLARISEGRAARFEVYFRGVELANGFYELRDARLQEQRFAEDNQKRQSMGLPLAAADPYLLAALEHGLPACSGVALGIDRLLALALGCEKISQVMAFDIGCA